MIVQNDVKVYETPLLNCWFDSDGILYSVSKVADRNIENYRLLFEVYRELSEDGRKKICTIGNISKTQPMPKGVREYIAAELPKYIRSMALISDTIMGKAIGNIFITLSPSAYPVRIFSNMEEAVVWSKKHL
jgi:hypothetical protein